MRHAQRFAFTLSALLALQALPGIAFAGPIYDWWVQHWAAKRQPPVAVAAAPVMPQVCCETTACDPCNMGCNSCTPTYAQYAQPTVVNFAPRYSANYAAASYGATNAYSPAYAQAAPMQYTAGYAPAGYAPTVAGYAPAAYAPNYAVAPQRRYRGFFSRYRSAWAQVPVTSYRPVAGVDPSSGLPVTSLQPCMTYDWQVRRVPVTVLNPGYYAAAPAYAPTSYAGGAMVVQGGAAGCASCASDGTYGGTPYYGATTTMPSSTPTLAPTPAVTVPAGPAGTFVPAETAPADSAPSLGPIQLNQGASYRPTPATPAAQPSVRVSRPAAGNDLGPGIKPVPDPDAPVPPAPVPPANERREPAPELNSPRDLTAGVPMRRIGAYVPVSAIQPAAHQAADEPKWDASGWKSVK
jgi:hypothetical protein